MLVSNFIPWLSLAAIVTFDLAKTSTSFSIAPPTSTAFFVVTKRPNAFLTLKAAESEVSFDNLDGSKMRIGIIRTRWNKEHVDNLVTGIRQGLAACNVTDNNIFETTVPGSFELPLAARFLALSGTVDAIIATGVLIKGDTLHFEYIADAVASGLMSTGLSTTTPIIFGVLTCLTEEQVRQRSSGDNNHGVDWGKTAVEMALLRTEALGGKSSAEGKLAELGFGLGLDKAKEQVKKAGTFF